jgi:hypothetical protein
MSVKDAIPDTYQKTKDLVQNWYKGKISARALHFNIFGNKKISKPSQEEEGFYQQISIATTNTTDAKTICIYCSKMGHGAQTCHRLIEYLRKQQQMKSSYKNNNHSNREYASFASVLTRSQSEQEEEWIDESIGC